MNRSGGVKTGLIFLVVLLAAVAYYGIEVGGVYWRKYQLEDTVAQQLGLAGQASDDGIRERIRLEIADLGLPPDATRFSLVRTERPRRLEFSMSYTETVNLLFTTKQISVVVTSSRRF